MMPSLLLEPQRHGVREKILLLDKTDVAKALKAIGWTVDSRGVIYNEKGYPVTCSACGDLLSTDSVGSFFPGSIEPICAKFQCFLSEMAKVDERLRTRAV
jgi:hypothetical protein